MNHNYIRMKRTCKIGVAIVFILALAACGRNRIIISGNISQSIEADSILINTDSYPYYFRYIIFLFIKRKIWIH